MFRGAFLINGRFPQGVLLSQIHMVGRAPGTMIQAEAFGLAASPMAISIKSDNFRLQQSTSERGVKEWYDKVRSIFCSSLTFLTSCNCTWVASFKALCQLRRKSET